MCPLASGLVAFITVVGRALRASGQQGLEGLRATGLLGPQGNRALRASGQHGSQGLRATGLAGPQGSEFMAYGFMAQGRG